MKRRQKRVLLIALTSACALVLFAPKSTTISKSLPSQKTLQVAQLPSNTSLFEDAAFTSSIVNTRFGNLADAGGQTDLQASASDEVVWLYSLITTDYNGSSIIPHFIKYYSELGIPFDRFFVDLLHDPALPSDGLIKARKLFRDVGARQRTIMQAYTPHLQDQAMMSGLSQMPMHPNDWVIVADMDEFFTYGYANINEAVNAMSKEGATYALGEMLDHVAEHGQLKHVSECGSLWDQYPWICPVVSAIGKGLPTKVTLHKAFLRTGAGHHHIVEPHLAEAYFSNNCQGLQCELAMKRYKQRTSSDVYMLTPYSKFADRYAFHTTPYNQGWNAKQWSVWTKVHHFKWHAAVLENLRLRMTRDNGDCVLNVNEDDCQPNFQFWKELARQFDALNATRRIDTKLLGCQVGLDTLWTW